MIRPSRGPWQDRLEVRDLAEQYAAAVDRLDHETFVGLFTEDAAVVLCAGNDRREPPHRVHQGHASIGEIIDAVSAAYVRTVHLVGGHRCQVAGDRAFAEVTCAAHHLTPDPNRHGATDYVMLVRYEDECVRTAQGWLFASRHVMLEWSTTSPVLAGEVRGNGGLRGREAE